MKDYNRSENLINLLTSKLRTISLLYWPGNFLWRNYRLTNKRYARDNRLMSSKRSYRRTRLAPRCRLITSWWCTIYQGSSCSLVKVVRELGLKRRETVWSLSTVFFKKLAKFYSSTRGPGRTNLWFIDYLVLSRSKSYVGKR